MRPHEPLRIALRDHEGEVIRTVDVVEASMPEYGLAAADGAGSTTKSGAQEHLGAAHTIHEFEGSTPEYKRLGGRGCLRSAIDDANGSPIPRQLGGHDQTDRSRTNNQGLVHAALRPRKRATLIIAVNRQGAFAAGHGPTAAT